MLQDTDVSGNICHRWTTSCLFMTLGWIWMSLWYNVIRLDSKRCLESEAN